MLSFNRLQLFVALMLTSQTAVSQSSPLPLVELLPYSFDVPVVHAITRMADGGFAVGGNFRVAESSCSSYLRINVDFSFHSCLAVSGTVRAVAALGNDAVIGGTFSAINGNLSPTLVIAGGAVNWDFAVWNPGSGAGSYSMAPVYALETDPSGNIYVAGGFTYAGPLPGAGSIFPRPGFAKFTPGLAIDRTFSPLSSGAGVWRLHYQAGYLYVGGFGPMLFRMNSQTGAANDWGPTVGCSVSSNCFNPAVMGMASDAEGNLYISGIFDTLNGKPHRMLARLDAQGSVDPTWAPVERLSNRPEGIDLALDGSSIYLSMYGCSFFSDNRLRCGLVKLSTIDGKVDRRLPNLGGYVYAVKPSPEGALAGGESPVLARYAVPLFWDGFESTSR